VKQTIKQLIKRAKRPSKKETRKGRQPYEPKKAPPFLLDDLLKMRKYCLNGIEVSSGILHCDKVRKYHRETLAI